MKFLCIFPIILILSLNLNAQTTISEGKIWSEVIYNYMDQIVGTNQYKFEGDTIVETNTYLKVYRSTDEFMTNWVLTYSIIREDSEKRVFTKHDSYPETMIYDFDVNIGDTVDIIGPDSIDIYVDTIYEEEVSGITRKIIILTDGIGNFEKWFEGIGSTRGILHSCEGIFMYVGGYTQLLCAFDNDIQIFQNAGFTDCYIVNSITNEYTSDNYYSYSLNNRKLNIDLKNEPCKTMVSFYDISGKLICLSQANDKSICFDLNFISKGIYILKIESNGFTASEKIALFD